jgi:hypothetical protein
MFVNSSLTWHFLRDLVSFSYDSHGFALGTGKARTIGRALRYGATCSYSGRAAGERDV